MCRSHRKRCCPVSYGSSLLVNLGCQRSQPLPFRGYATDDSKIYQYWQTNFPLSIPVFFFSSITRTKSRTRHVDTLRCWFQSQQNQLYAHSSSAFTGQPHSLSLQIGTQKQPRGLHFQSDQWSRSNSSTPPANVIQQHCSGLRLFFVIKKSAVFTQTGPMIISTMQRACHNPIYHGAKKQAPHLAGLVNVRLNGILLFSPEQQQFETAVNEKQFHEQHPMTLRSINLQDTEEFKVMM